MGVFVRTMLVTVVVVVVFRKEAVLVTVVIVLCYVFLLDLFEEVGRFFLSRLFCFYLFLLFSIRTPYSV